VTYRTTPDLKQAEKGGAAGVISIWNNVSDGSAEGQAVPFTSAPSPVPTVGVTQSTGRKLKSLAASGVSLNLTIHAISHPDTPTGTVGVRPGENG
jgi:hypothetical protein